MKADWSAAWVHSLEGDSLLLRAMWGDSKQRVSGGEKDYIYHHAYVLQSKRLACHFLPPASPPSVMIAETVIKAVAGS